MSKATQRKKKKRTADKVDSTVMWSLFDSVSTSRAKLKPEMARAFFVLCQSLSDEHEESARGCIASMQPGSASGIERYNFHLNAASAFRMMADRVLKSWDTFKLIAVEKAVAPVYLKAVDRLSRSHSAKSKPIAQIDSGERF